MLNNFMANNMVKINNGFVPRSVYQKYAATHPEADGKCCFGIPAIQPTASASGNGLSCGASNVSPTSYFTIIVGEGMTGGGTIGLGNDITIGLDGTPVFDGTNFTNLPASSLTGTELPNNITTSYLTHFGTSPILTGIPTAPTAGAGTNTTQLATTSFVTEAYTTLYSSLGTLATLNEAPAGTLTGTTLAANVLASSLTSVGVLTGGTTGAGFTLDLSTSTVTGSLADARLSANVPLKNAANTFTAAQQFGASSGGTYNANVMSVLNDRYAGFKHRSGTTDRFQILCDVIAGGLSYIDSVGAMRFRDAISGGNTLLSLATAGAAFGVPVTAPSSILTPAAGVVGLSIDAVASPTANPFRVRLNSVDTVWVGTNGKLSVIGNTADNSAEFGAVTIQSFSTNNCWVGNNVVYNGGFKYVAAGYASMFLFGNGDFGVRTAPSGSAGGAAAMTDRFYVSQAGLVGINYTNPQTMLDVVSNLGSRVVARLHGATSQSASLLEFWGTSSTQDRVQAALDTAWSTSTDATRQASVSLSAYGIVGGVETKQVGLTVTAQSSGNPTILLTGTSLVFGTSNSLLQITTSILRVANTQTIGWSASASASGTASDIGLARNAAGVVEVNNGTAGVFADLKLKNLTASGVIHSPITSTTGNGTTTLTLTTANIHSVTLTANTTIALSGDVDGDDLVLYVRGQSSGYTITWFAGIKWVGGTPPTLPTVTGQLMCIVIKRIASGEYFGSASGIAS
jgi:hypothetical protein